MPKAPALPSFYEVEIGSILTDKTKKQYRVVDKQKRPIMQSLPGSAHVTSLLCRKLDPPEGDDVIEKWIRSPAYNDNIVAVQPPPRAPQKRVRRREPGSPQPNVRRRKT